MAGAKYGKLPKPFIQLTGDLSVQFERTFSAPPQISPKRVQPMELIND